MANKYRLSEQFFSIQGEGKFAGQPSLWARVFGCNLKCPGFPCDTEYSWNGDFVDQTTSLTAIEIVDNWIEMLKTKDNPNGLLRHPITGNDVHLVFTGGEPLLPKYQKMIIEVYNELQSRNLNNTPINISVESNGTQPLSADFIEFLDTDYVWMYFFFSFSPKLETVSGEKEAVNYTNIANVLKEYEGQLKFVCDETDECESELDAVVSRLNSEKSTWQAPYDYWVMPLGTTREDQLQIAPIVEKYQAKGFKIATRNHTYIWSDAKNR